jgi:hypothetical protein
VDGLAGFMLRQLKQKNIYLLFLATTTMTLMFAWKGVIRNELFWDVNNK